MNNSAYRLLVILQRARSFMPTSEATVATGWRWIFRIPESEPDAKLLSKYGRVLTLPAKITRQIHAIPGINHRMYLGWSGELSRAFAQCSFGTSFETFRERLTEPLLVGIEFCAGKLRLEWNESELTEDEIIELRDAAWQLFEEALASSLPEQLKQYIKKQLGMIIEALDDYDITGTGRIEEAVNATAGTIFTNRATAAAAAQTPLGARMWEIVGRIGIMLKMADDGAKLGERVIKALE